jgi:hypothetical protein
MQYILSLEEFEEYLAVKAKGEVLRQAEAALSEVRNHLLKEANYTCVHECKGRYEGYCDGCPCSPLDHNDYNLWKVICGRSLRYGK